MSALFEEIDYRTTPLGAISLRRRRLLSLDRDVFEVMLGDEHLMSSLFTEGEIALTEIGLAASDAPVLDVVVGGLGLGYTAAAALDDPRVRSVVVIDAIEAVIDWHRQGLVPLGARLTEDPRCSLVHGDFFAMMAEDGPAPVHAVLLDIDHSPRALLNAANGAFYSAEGLGGVARWLWPGGVFAMWSDEAPDPEFEAAMAEVFEACAATVVEFPNPLTGGRSSCTIYTGRKPEASAR
jgi:spermidine synthase